MDTTLISDYFNINGRCYSHSNVGRCCAMNFLADVIATIICYNVWLMESTVVGVITTCVEYVADFIAKVADGIATW